MNKLLLLLLVISTTSCNLSMQHESVSIKELLPVGSMLNLTRNLTIPAGRSYIYLAEGKVARLKNFNTVDIYEPYCMFHLKQEADYAREIKPDQFEITKIVEWERDYASRNFMKVSSNSYSAYGFINMAGGNDGGPSIVMYATILSLHSVSQPEVKEMVCGHWDDQHKIEPLTLEEMKTALGNLIVIKTKKNNISSNVIQDNTYF